MEQLTQTTAEQSKSLLTSEQLSRLFDTDLEYLKSNGSLDLFYYDDTYDGLMHTLIGDDSGGFHSESAAQILGLNHPSVKNKTMVDRWHLSHKNTKERRDYRERPFEPFGARVVIDGILKTKYKPSEDGTHLPITNSMYPSEYDPTAVVQTVAIAYKNIDPEQDIVSVTPNGTKIILNDSGWVPMLDGSSRMRVYMMLDSQTRKVMSAYPETVRKGYMNLSDTEADKLLVDGKL